LYLFYSVLLLAIHYLYIRSTELQHECHFDFTLAQASLVSFKARLLD
jgi:hypothetical protein